MRAAFSDAPTSATERGDSKGSSVERRSSITSLSGGRMFSGRLQLRNDDGGEPPSSIQTSYCYWVFSKPQTLSEAGRQASPAATVATTS